MTEPTVFGTKATEQIATTVREVARRVMNEQPHRARWQHQSSGGGTQIISFSIVSSVAGSQFANVEILQRAFTGTVYGSDLGDTVVVVYDTDGCHLNEPNVDLTGRRGKAVLMLVDAQAAALHFADDYDPPKWYWNVLTLCCPTIICEG